MCNEAALIAARHDKVSVDEQDFEAAIDRVTTPADNTRWRFAAC